MANINKIKLSGTTYTIQDENATKTLELTQAQYDALVDKDPNTFYIITDATAGDLSNYYTKSETDDLLDTKLDVSAYTPTDLSNYYTKSETSGATQISTALNAKQNTLVAGDNITISGNVISASGGAASSAITSGDTNAVAGGAVYSKFDEVEQVTAAALNALNDNFGGLKLVKLTQAEYDALTTKDTNTLYVIV